MLGAQSKAAINNPSISAVGDLYGRYHVDDKQAYFGLGSLELGVYADIDPFATARFYIVFPGSIEVFEGGHSHGDHEEEEESHGESLEIEEANITLTTLPAGFQVTAGRFLSKNGLVSAFHLHDFHFLGFPKIVRETLGVEGLRTTGVGVNWLAPLPFFFEIVVEGQALGKFGDDFFDTGINLSWNLGEDHTLKATGWSKFDVVNSKAVDFDLWSLGLKYKWKPAEKGGSTHVLLVGELYGYNEEHEGKTETLFGYWGMVEYLFAKRFSAGILFDHVVGHEEEAHEEDEENGHHEEGEEEAKGTDLVFNLSFMPSEFQRIRLEYELPLTEELTDHRISLNWSFFIGPHQTHRF